MKNFSGITDNLDIPTKKYVDDNKVTSIDGLAGGTLTSPFVATGGDAVTASKIALNQSGSGQITDSGTSTIFGFMNTADLTIGSTNYNTRFRGKETRPKYNGNDLALKSDVPSVPTNYVTTDTAQNITAEKKFLSSLTVDAKDDGSTGFKVTQGDVAGGDTLFNVDINGIDLDVDAHNIPLLISGNAGVAGQALVTGGANNAPKWLSIPKLEGGNTFKGEQEITRNDSGILLNVTNVLGDSFFQIDQNADNPDGNIYIGMDTAQTPISFDGSFGLEGQALLSRGSEHTPTWGDITKHGYTELTNEDLNTITEAGWYRAASGNTCTNRPSRILSTYPFVLEVEKSTDAYTKQTLYMTGNSSAYTSAIYFRMKGSSWASWQESSLMYQNVNQTFSGRKTFSGGINLQGSLQVNGSAGTSGQVLTSTGVGAPVWADAGGSTDTMPTIRLVSIADIAGTCICSAANPLRFSFVVEKGTLLPTDMVQLCSRQLFTYGNGHMLRPGDPAVHGRTYKLRQFFSKEISTITQQQGHYVFEVNSYPELREFVRSNMGNGEHSTLIRYLRISRVRQSGVSDRLFSNVIPIYVAPSSPDVLAETVKIRIR